METTTLTTIEQPRISFFNRVTVELMKVGLQLRSYALDAYAVFKKHPWSAVITHSLAANILIFSMYNPTTLAGIILLSAVATLGGLVIAATNRMILAACTPFFADSLPKGRWWFVTYDTIMAFGTLLLTPALYVQAWSMFVNIFYIV